MATWLYIGSGGAISYLDNDAWLDHTDVLNPANTNLMNMLDTVNSGGNAVELYFVNQLDLGSFAGIHNDKGISIATEGIGRTIAHEVLHGCGLEDIYVTGDTNEPLPDKLDSSYLPYDWGGGYYPFSLSLDTLIQQLVMSSGIGYTENPQSNVIPRCSVFGWILSTPGSGSNDKIMGYSPVGQSSIQRFPGNY